MSLKCLQCENNDISYWCLDKFCQKNLICDQCSLRHGKLEKILNNEQKYTDFQKTKIKTWVRKMMKNMLSIMDRLYGYQNEIDEKFKENQQNQTIEILKQRLQYYSQYLQFNPKIQSALYNLNNQLNNYNFPEAKTVNIDEIDALIQLNTCKKLLHEKQYAKAAQKILTFKGAESKYFQIECQILQNNLKHALDLSIQAINSQTDDVNLKFNLQLQQAKIFHKQKEYSKALSSLKDIEPQANDKYRFDLQLGMKFNQIRAKTLIKCGYFQQGYQKILDIKNKSNYQPKQCIEKEIQEQEDLDKKPSDLNTKSKKLSKNSSQTDIQEFESQLQEFKDKYKIKKYFVGNFEFSLALAKAHFKKIYHLQDDNEQDSQNNSNQIVIIFFKFNKLQKKEYKKDSNNTSEQIVIIFFKFNKLEEAQNIYQEILKVEPTNQKALYGLSQILTRQRKFIEARELLYQLLQLNPKYRKAESGLLFIKLKISDQQDDVEDQFQTFEGCLGFIYGLFKRNQ